MPYRRPIAKNADPSGSMTLPKIRNKEKKSEWNIADERASGCDRRGKSPAFPPAEAGEAV